MRSLPTTTSRGRDAIPQPEPLTELMTTKASNGSEATMPVLKVLAVGEVPTVTSDPVDPVARVQAKVSYMLSATQNSPTMFSNILIDLTVCASLSSRTGIVDSLGK